MEASSLLENYRATYCLYNITNGAGGSAVAVKRIRDASGNSYLILATAAHCVLGVPDETIELISSEGLRHPGARVVVLDRLHDIAFLVVHDLPDAKVARVPGPRLRTYPDVGSNVYTIGWPALLDQHSVSKGCVRSSAWTAWGVNYVLIDAPIIGGNSGGGVFDSETHELIGIVSFGFEGATSINGVVPAYCVSEGVRMLSALDPTPDLCALPLPYFSRNEYYIGIACLDIPFNVYSYIVPSDVPFLAKLAAAGVIVRDVSPESALVGQVQPGDVIWALRLTRVSNEGDWTPITQLKSLDCIIHEISMEAFQGLQPRPLRGGRFRSAHGRGWDGVAAVPALRDGDSRLPSTLLVDFLITSFSGDWPPYVRTVTALLQKRSDYLQTHQELSTWVNVYMSESVQSAEKGVRRIMQAGQLRNDVCKIVMESCACQNKTIELQN